LTEIRDALGGGFEYFAARVVEAVLRERGVECSVRVNVTLPVDGFKEVDLFCPEPLVVGEVSVAVEAWRRLRVFLSSCVGRRRRAKS